MKAILLSLLFLFSSFVCAMKTQEEAVDEIFSTWSNVDEPGAAVGVFKEGKVIYARGYGLANLEYDIPIDENSVFRIGSTSKQFTAACVVLLAEQGKLKLTDSLHSFFPEFPEYAKDITVRQLMNHNSGIRDYSALSYLKGLREGDYYDDKDVMQWLISQTTLDFAPGEEDLYSNSGYWLLGQIVKQVTKMDMAEFATKELFKPLGMHQTHFHNNHKAIVKNRASGYTPKEAGAKDEHKYEISMTHLNMIGDGGIFTTINDIKKWDDAYYNSQVLSEKFWQEMTTEGQLNNGKKTGYASGLIIEKYKGLNTISHSGSFVGFRAELLRFPDQKFTVAVFANRSDANPTSMAYEIAEIYLKDELIPEPLIETSNKFNSDDESRVQMESAALEQLTGSYKLEPGVQFTVSIQDGILHAHQSWNEKEYDFESIENSVNAFKIVGDEAFVFTFDDFRNNHAQVINLAQNGSNSTWTRVKTVDTSSVVLSDFVGDYYSKELDVVYHIKLNDDALTVHVGKTDQMALKVSGIDQLSYRSILYDFKREGGLITGFTMASGGVNNLAFTRQ